LSGNQFTADLPGSLTMRAGQALRLPLAGALGAGNTWTVATDSPAVDARIEITPPPPPADPPSSTTATETLVLTARSPGTTWVSLRLGRSWSPGALAEHRFPVTVG
jgi:hypothetical protein